MAFWGIEVKAGKTAAYVPPPEQARLRLSQATLSLDASPGEKAALRCKVGNEEVLICSLREGGQETTNLDLILDTYTELSLATKAKNTKASIHVAGYLIAESEEEEEEDDEDAELPEALQGLTPEQLQAYMNEDSEGSDEEYEEESNSEEDDEDPQSTVIIEDITEQEQPKGSAGALENGKADGAKEGKKAKSKQAKAALEAAVKELDEEELDALVAAEEEEEEDSDEEMDEDVNSDEEEEDSILSESEEEENGIKVQPAKDAGKKRKAEAQAVAKAEPKEKADGKSKKAKVDSAVAAANVTPAAAPDKPMKGKKTYPNGFVVENVTMGDPAGKLAKAGKKVLVKYIGKLQKSGKIFDQTKGYKPFAFRLGVGEVIKGWDQGVAGMRVGDKRKLIIPPQMAYGPKGIPNVIPGNSTLLFDVELVDVK